MVLGVWSDSVIVVACVSINKQQVTKKIKFVNKGVTAVLPRIALQTANKKFVLDFVYILKQHTVKSDIVYAI